MTYVMFLPHPSEYRCGWPMAASQGSKCTHSPGGRRGAESGPEVSGRMPGATTVPAAELRSREPVPARCIPPVGCAGAPPGRAISGGAWPAVGAREAGGSAEAGTHTSTH
eukprot:scaffold16669_cov129-Isochrysis_galbana.AAC.3